MEMEMDSAEHSSHHVASIISSDPAPADSSNGDLHQNLPPLDPAEPSNANLAGELAESRSANQDLVEEVLSLRDSISEEEQRTALLQKELHDKHGREQDLSAEISSLQVQNREHAEKAVCLAHEVQVLHDQKVHLQYENAKIALGNESLDVTLAEVKKKLSLLSDLDGKRAAMAMTGAQAQVLMICFEVEKLRLEKEEYSKEISMLDASNEIMNAQVALLQEEEKALLSEIDDILAAKARADQEVSDFKATVETLDMQFLTLTTNLPNQLDEAKERLRDLEDLDNAMARREADMVAHIKDLKQQLHALRVNFDTTCQSLDQEEAKVNSSRALEIACMKVEASEGDLQTLRSAPQMHVKDADASQQHIQKLESQVAALRAETRDLARSNEELKAMLIHQQNEMAASIQLNEDVKKLEGFLNEAEEKAQALKEREAELKSKLQELTISVSKKPSLGGLTTPLIISGGTIFVVGLLVCFWHAKAKSK